MPYKISRQSDITIRWQRLLKRTLPNNREQLQLLHVYNTIDKISDKETYVTYFGVALPMMSYLR